MEISYFAQTMLNSVMLGVTYSLIALGFTLIYGIARVVNFAHGEIYMVGAFGAYYLTVKLGLPFFVAIVLCALGTGILGIVLERILFRRVRPLKVGTSAEFPTVVITLGLVLIIPALAAVICGTREKGVPGAVSGIISFGGVILSVERLVTMVIGLGLFVGLLFFIRWHKEGRALKAVAQDSEAAVLQGVSLDRAASLSFGIGFGLAGIAGALIAPLYYVDPTLGPPTLLKTFIVVILGGIGSIPGTFLGGLLLGFIESFGRALFGGNLPMLIAFLLVIVLLVIRPVGLLGHE